MQHDAAAHELQQAIDDRSQRLARRQRPIAQRLLGPPQAVATEDRLLAVQRQVVGELLHQQPREQIRSRDASLQRARRAPRVVLLLEGSALIVLLALTAAVIVVRDPVALGPIGLGTLALCGAYALAARLLHGQRGNARWQPVEPPPDSRSGRRDHPWPAAARAIRGPASPVRA
jgi:hypothetical protein